jgi:hypothetical protein
MLTINQLDPDDDLEDLTLYSSLYAYHAYCEQYDETPIDSLVRLFYLDPASEAA